MYSDRTARPGNSRRYKNGRYTWYGPVVDDNSGVGHLVATEVIHLVTPLQVPASLGTRVVITKVGDHMIQGVYSTYVGKYTRMN